MSVKVEFQFHAMVQSTFCVSVTYGLGVLKTHLYSLSLSDISAVEVWFNPQPMGPEPVVEPHFLSFGLNCQRFHRDLVFADTSSFSWLFLLVHLTLSPLSFLFPTVTLHPLQRHLHLNSCLRLNFGKNLN